MTESEIQEKAKEIAAKYKTMRYGLGSFKRYSTDEWMKEMNEFLAPLNEEDTTKVREKFFSLVGLDGDRGNAHDKFLRDFPG